MRTRISRRLWLDCSAGFLAGVLVLTAHGWLARLYQLPTKLLLSIGMANLAYASCSLSMAVAPRFQTRRGVRALAMANLCWATGCFAAGAFYFSSTNAFGLLQLWGEGVFVGVLGLQEWRAASAGS